MLIKIGAGLIVLIGLMFLVSAWLDTPNKELKEWEKDEWWS